MSNFPKADDLLVTHQDLADGLISIWKDKSNVIVNQRSGFFGLSEAELDQRLKQDREELDQWAVMMLAASFEAVLRTDAIDRIKRKTKDAIRKPLRDLHSKYGPRVRFEDILELWEQHATIAATVRQDVRRLLNLRHWLAHGRHWVDKKSGMEPIPRAIYNTINLYIQDAQAAIPDFPRS